MKRRLAILGSTGSVGTQTLDVVRQFRDDFDIVALTAGRNVSKLEEQVQEFSPRYFNTLEHGAITRISDASWMPVDDIVTHDDIDIVMHATSGIDGVSASAAALSAGKTLLLSNKEAIVIAGRHLKQLESECGGRIIPVDSEPSALWQCLLGETSKPIRYFITASGGPFIDRGHQELDDVMPEEALNHPTWSMGHKITIDCATLMNKAFEVIETSWLFDAPLESIEVVIHRQSIIHSMVEMKDGSIKAQMNLPDMCGPIQFALFYPQRRANRNMHSFNPVSIGRLTFEAMDPGRYPGFDLAMEHARKCESYGAALAGADEAAVQLFLGGKLRFTQIVDEIEKTITLHRPRTDYSISEAVQIADWARATTLARYS